MKSKQIRLTLLLLNIIISTMFSPSHGHRLDLPHPLNDDRVSISEDGNRYAFTQSPFPLAAAVIFSALAASPLAWTLYRKYTPLKELMSFSKEGIRLYEKQTISWDELHSITEATVGGGIEIRTDNDEVTTVSREYLFITKPQLLALAEYYKILYKKGYIPAPNSQVSSNEVLLEQDGFPKLGNKKEVEKYVAIAEDKSSTIIYELKPDNWELFAWSIVATFFGVTPWYLWDAGRKEGLVFDENGLTEKAIWFGEDDCTSWKDIEWYQTAIDYRGEHNTPYDIVKLFMHGEKNAKKSIDKGMWGIKDKDSLWNLVNFFMRKCTYRNYTVYNIVDDTLLKKNDAMYTTYLVDNTTKKGKKICFNNGLSVRFRHHKDKLVDGNGRRWHIDDKGNFKLVDTGTQKNEIIKYSVEDINDETVNKLATGDLRYCAFTNDYQSNCVHTAEIIDEDDIDADKPGNDDKKDQKEADDIFQEPTIQRQYTLGEYTIYNIPETQTNEGQEQRFTTFIVNNATKKVQRVEFYYLDKVKNEYGHADFQFYIDDQGRLVDGKYKAIWKITDEGRLNWVEGYTGSNTHSWWTRDADNDLFDGLTTGSLNSYTFIGEYPQDVKDYYNPPPPQDPPNNEPNNENNEDDHENEGDFEGDEGDQEQEEEQPGESSQNNVNGVLLLNAPANDPVAPGGPTA